jgi:integrase
MPDSLAVVAAGAPLARLETLVDAARGFAQAARSPRTRDAYRKAWATFAGWCEGHGLPPLPAEPATVALFVSARASAGRTVATIAQSLAAIGEAHKLAGQPSPCEAREVREVWKGVRRTLGVAPRQKAAATVDVLRTMARALPVTARGTRDRAILVVGMAAALRRSELAGLDVGDVAFVADGLEITIRRSKTDQDGRGAVVGVPHGSDPVTCPVRTLRAWLDASVIAEGPVFRGIDRGGRVRSERLTGHAIARIVKRAASLAGLDSRVFSGHSLRAGLATSSAKAGKPDRAIMRQGRWTSRAMVDRYVRAVDVFEENAASGIGL